ncbi:MAG: oligosaccharide flippase family protein [Patescibacteria group bacterium]
MEKLKLKTVGILRWSERYTKTDMLYLAKGGFWMTFGQTFSSIISLILIIFFANYLPKETYGTYRYILSLAGVLNVFALNGMNSAVARAVATGHEGALRTSVRYQFKWNLLMFTTFFVLGGYYFVNGNSLFATSFLILGIFVPFTLALNTYGAYLEGKKEFKFANISSVISSFMYAAGMLAAILFSGEVFWLITAYAVTTFASTLFFYIVILRKFKPPVAEAGETLKYGRRLTFIGFIEPLTSQIDKIILAHFWGPAQLATYSLAMAVPGRLTSFIKVWVGLGSPKFATKMPEEINTVFYKRILQGMFIGAIVAFFYILFSPYLFKYLLPQYLDGVFYSQILAIGLVFAMPNRYISLLLVSQKLSGTIFTTSLIQVVIKILLYVVLGIWGGIMGLVLAYVAVSFVGMLINIAMWRFKNPKYN